MADHLALSTQERAPWAAALRPMLAALVALLPILNVVAAFTIEMLKPYEVHVPAWVFLGLNGVVVVTALLAAWVTRVLATPGVNDWFRRYLPSLAPEGKSTSPSLAPEGKSTTPTT